LSVLSGNPKRTELDAARAHMTEELAPDVKRSAFTFKVYKADEVKRRLEELFHGKCAYCESFYASQAPVDIEHYRPKGAVEGAPDHPGYWWLGMEWSNLLPSCLDCNRRRKQKAPDHIGDLNLLYKATQSGKKDSFPVAGARAVAENAELAAEQALLLDPTRDDPSAHLTYWLGDDAAGGLILPKRVNGSPSSPIELAAAGLPEEVAAEAEQSNLSVRGAVSIQVYGLNRIRLVQERARLIQRMRFLEILAINLGDIAHTLEQAGLDGEPAVTEAIRNLKLLQGNILSEMRGLAAPEMPYSTLAAAYLADFKERLSVSVLP
jgi:uncharacterized protein (TIGR02646 family)